MSKRKFCGPSDGCNCVCMEKYSSLNNLPKEIVVEIVFRLPPESLMRLKSLNKSWYFVIRCLIKDPDFVAKHHRYAGENPTVLLVNHCCLKNPPEILQTGLSKPRQLRLRSTFMTRLVDNGNIRCVTENINVSHLPNSLTRSSRNNIVAYHCNGIICFTKGCIMKIFTLYSPVTGKFETFQPKQVRGCGDIEIRGMGFGSDPGGNNFKVVRILDSTRAHVFTPGTSDSWREIEISIEGVSRCVLFRHLYWKGYCFWIAYDRPSYKVLCFDVCNETFRLITLPKNEGGFKLATVEDSVCLLLCSYEKKSIDVWVMDIDSFSWRKWLRTEPFKGFCDQLTFWSSNELLMEIVNRELAVYDIKAQKLTSVSPKVKLGNNVFYFGAYVKSLASIKWFL